MRWIFRIYPNKTQRLKIQETLGCCRFIWNKMLEDKIKHYHDYGVSLNNHPAQYKDEFPWLRDVDSSALSQTHVDLIDAFNRFFQNKTNFPKWKTKKDKNPKINYRTGEGNFNQKHQTLRIKNNRIWIPKLKWVKIKLHRDIPENWIIKNITVKSLPSGKYEVTVCFQYEENHVAMNTQGRGFFLRETAPKCLGLDYSSSQLFIDSNGDSGNYPKFYRKSEDKLKKEKIKLSKMNYGSNNYIKQKKKVAKIHERIGNQRKDFQHKLSRKIANSYDVVCVESLNMKAIAKHLRLGKSTMDNSYGLFLRQLNYKLLAQPFKILLKVDMFFPSTQLCSVCGNKKHMSLSERRYICPCCDLEIDRDLNSAINIRDEGIRGLIKIRKECGYPRWI
jgi:putative transposase